MCCVYFILFLSCRQTERNHVQQFPEMDLRSFWTLSGRLSLPARGNDGGDGGAAERQEVSRKRLVHSAEGCEASLLNED